MLSELAALRDQIDAVDRQILQQLAQRMHLVLRVGELKRQHGMAVYDAERERRILEQLAALASSPLEPEAARRIFQCLIDEARALEQRHVAGSPNR